LLAAVGWLRSPLLPTPWLGLSSRQGMTQPRPGVQSVLIGSSNSLQGDEGAKKASY